MDKTIKTMAAALAACALYFAPAGPTSLAGVTDAAAQGVITVGRNAGRTERINLGLDKSLVIDLPADAHDILVANPKVADAVTRSKRRIYLFGKEVGTTNIFVFDRQGRQIVGLDLKVERDISQLEDYLERYIPGSDITAEIVNDNIILTGTVQTPIDSAKANQLAQVFVQGGEATTGQYASVAAGGEEEGDVDIDNPDGERQRSEIINLIEIRGSDQVALKVVVAEIQRSVIKQLGSSFQVNSTSGDITFSALSDPNFGALGKPLGGSRIGIGGSIGSVGISASLQAMEEVGVMKTLAEPTLTAISGETAVFRAGGQYNIIQGATADDDDGVVYTVQEIDYGVGLEFTPIVLGPGRISLKIRTSVSEPTTEGSVGGFVGNSAYLSLRKRLADTTVELPSGGSMMIAGLLRDDVRQVASGFPGLSKVPVLGALFRSRDYIRNETELVILVTPYLVRPKPANELASPTDNFVPAGDAASFILGRVNRVYGNAGKAPPKGAYHGTPGFIFK
ncbi:MULTISPECIES: type II and III secretion system protein family protein [unclassified Roseitalea]|uniref:type II and III secretion system protein family protein n=1 Tax=unclassified Roseitalea TaxID=2639107 RepID=UPI00273F825E|nr:MULTISPECIES: type II and III secretion system protein family protein [unclassified Roseitalea]